MNEKLDADFRARCAAQAGRHYDMAEHLPVLSRYASACRDVVEFGVRTGNSTCALLHGLEQAADPARLFSFDLEPAEYAPPPLENTSWKFAQADTADLATIPECDLLLVDSLHTAAQVAAELRHAGRVRSWIFLHDTITWGSVGEKKEPGITDAIYQFLANEKGEWRVQAHWPQCHGLLCLARAGRFHRAVHASPYLFPSA